MTFDEWAILGKDEGMEKGHHNSVAQMLGDVFKSLRFGGAPSGAVSVTLA